MVETLKVPSYAYDQPENAYKKEISAVIFEEFFFLVFDFSNFWKFVLNVSQSSLS